MQQAIGELTWRQMKGAGPCLRHVRPVGSATTESVTPAARVGNAISGVAWGLVATAWALAFLAGVMLAYADWVLG